QGDIAGYYRRWRARRGLSRRLGVDGLEPGPSPREVGLHRVDREVEHGGDLLQGLVEHVFKNHHAALHRRKLREPRHCGLDRLPSHHYLQRIWTLWVGNLMRRLNGLGCTDR